MLVNKSLLCILLKISSKVPIHYVDVFEKKQKRYCVFRQIIYNRIEWLYFTHFVLKTIFEMSMKRYNGTPFGVSKSETQSRYGGDL